MLVVVVTSTQPNGQFWITFHIMVTPTILWTPADFEEFNEFSDSFNSLKARIIGVFDIEYEIDKVVQKLPTDRRW